jgi:two-component system sporulation sensor kinase B
MHCQREERPARSALGSGEAAGGSLAGFRPVEAAGVDALGPGGPPGGAAERWLRPDGAAPGAGERRLHAMKNHLTVIEAGLALLERSVAPEQRERVLIMRRAADDLARLVAGDLAPAAREVIDLAALAREICAALGPRASEGGVALECEAEPCAVLGDRPTLAEALGNLVLNAIEATPPAGCVRVGARPLPGGAELSVVDTGHGMTEETLARLGQRGFTTRRGGSGLGLSIARQGVEELGGALRFESAPGAGTRVTVILG